VNNIKVNNNNKQQELHVYVNEQEVKSNEEWNQIKESYTTDQVLLIVVQMVLRDKSYASQEYINEQLEANRLSQLNTRQLNQHEINTALQSDWFDALVDRMMDGGDVGKDDETSVINNDNLTLADFVDPEILEQLAKLEQQQEEDEQ
jgi:hypothetical protein